MAIYYKIKYSFSPDFSIFVIHVFQCQEFIKWNCIFLLWIKLTSTAVTSIMKLWIPAEYLICLKVLVNILVHVYVWSYGSLGMINCMIIVAKSTISSNGIFVISCKHSTTYKWNIRQITSVRFDAEFYMWGGDGQEALNFEGFQNRPVKKIRKFHRNSKNIAPTRLRRLYVRFLF